MEQVFGEFGYIQVLIKVEYGKICEKNDLVVVFDKMYSFFLI